MNDFEKVKQIERGRQLLQEATDLCNSNPQNFVEAFEKSVQALEIFRDCGEEKWTELACNLLKRIDQRVDFDVEKELGNRGINFKSVCPLTDAEINKKIREQSKR